MWILDLKVWPQINSIFKQMRKLFFFCSVYSTTDFLANYLNSFRFFLFLDIIHSQSLEYIVKFEWLASVSFATFIICWKLNWNFSSKFVSDRNSHENKSNCENVGKKKQIEWTDITVETFESTKYICIKQIYDAIFRMGFSIISLCKTYKNTTIEQSDSMKSDIYF